MITCQSFFDILKKNEIDFFTGVPDSTFKDFINFLNDEHGKSLTNIIQASECEATATATGYNLATGKIPIVYMQNSGLGKCVNPLTSLCDKEVYSIPIILMIGWRGQPNIHDEPQHKKMGRITIPLLETLEIPYSLLSSDLTETEKIITEIKDKAEKTSSLVAIIVPSDIFEKYETKNSSTKSFELNREDAIKIVVDNLEEKDIIVSTTGKCSRELYEYRVSKNESPNDFYTVGSMGCASSIAHAIALSKNNKKVFVLDGDGAALMQLGAFSTIGHYPPENFYHIILDNQTYDSTGEQPTNSPTVDFEKIALACNYAHAKIVKTKFELEECLKEMKNILGPFLIVIKVNPGSRKDLGRPKSSPLENKQEFIKKLRE